MGGGWCGQQWLINTFSNGAASVSLVTSTNDAQRGARGGAAIAPSPCNAAAGNAAINYAAAAGDSATNHAASCTSTGYATAETTADTAYIHKGEHTDLRRVAATIIPPQGVPHLAQGRPQRQPVAHTPASVETARQAMRTTEAVPAKHRRKRKADGPTIQHQVRARSTLLDCASLLPIPAQVRSARVVPLHQHAAPGTRT